MKKISEFLKKERTKWIVYPNKDEEIFSAFKRLPFEKIKVVIIGQDPYHDSSYNGKAFSNSNDKKPVSPSLRNIMKELENDIYEGFLLNKDYTLDLWEEQGVFLINTCLTVRKGQPASHSKIGWDKFVGAALKELTIDKKPKMFILWGAHAKTFYSKYAIVNKQHGLIISSHPSPFSARKGFFGSKPFSKTNDFLIKNNINSIKWSLQ